MSSWFCLLVGFIYVGSLYVIVPSSIRLLPRDNVTHIKYRLIAAGSATIIAITLFLLFITPIISSNSNSVLNGIKLLGLWNQNVVLLSLKTIVLMMIFYLGPFTASMIIHWIECDSEISPFTGRCFPIKQKKSIIQVLFSSVQRELKEEDPIRIFRNLFFAPISEELVFRAVIVATLFITSLNSNFVTNAEEEFIISPIQLALHSTVYFGVAHAHHLLEKLRSGDSLFPAILSSIVQFTYTSIFGFIAAIFLIRTGSIVPSILSHMICNYIGLPNIGFFFPPNSSRRNTYCLLFPYRWLIGFLHILGLILFSICLFRWTEEDTRDSYYYHYRALTEQL